MLSCEVISDLMVVYESGVASPETKRLVEEHLASCPTCRQAFGKAEPSQKSQQVEQALGNTLAEKTPADGQKFIIRTRRLVFILTTGVLAAFMLVLVLIQKLEIINNVVSPTVSQLTQAFKYPEAQLWYWLAGISLIAYISFLVWRRNRNTPMSIYGVLWGFIAAVMFGVFCLSVLDLVLTRVWGIVILTLMSFIITLMVTFIVLPRVPYLTISTGAALIFVNILLVISMTIGLVSTSHFEFVLPSQLGHPAAGVTPEMAVQLDLESLGLTFQEKSNQTFVNRVWVGIQAESTQAIYNGKEGEVRLTVAHFEDESLADGFFTAWTNAIESPIRISSLEINLPGVPGEGRVVRLYNLLANVAYYAWRNGVWVTIIQVNGAYPQAVNLSLSIRGKVVESYKKSQ